MSVFFLFRQRLESCRSSMKSIGLKCREQISENLVGVKSFRGFAIIHFRHNAEFCSGYEWKVILSLLIIPQELLYPLLYPNYAEHLIVHNYKTS